MSDAQALFFFIFIFLAIESAVLLSATLAHRSEEDEQLKDVAWFGMILFGSMTFWIVSFIFLAHYGYLAAKAKAGEA